MARQKRTKAAGISPDLTPEKAALIKGMLARGDRQSDIAAYFQMNIGRVYDVKVRYATIEAAPADDLPPPGPYVAVPVGDAETLKKWRRKEATLAATRRWRIRNPDKVAEQTSRRAVATREHRRMQRKAYRQTPEYAEKRAKYHRNTFAARLVHSARKRAAVRGIACTVTSEWVQRRLDIGVCEATGLRFDFRKPDGSRTNPRAPSLDRMDVRGGYTPENCQVVCLQYNLAKSEWGPSVLAEMAKAVATSMTVA